MIRVGRRLNSTDVVDALTDLFILRGPPEFIRSDNGAEFAALKVRAWIEAVGAKTAYIEPGSPWENGYCESFNSRFRNKLLDGEVFYSLREAQILIERWRRHYNTVRPTAPWATDPRHRRASWPSTGDALTVKLDHSVRAAQGSRTASGQKRVRVVTTSRKNCPKSRRTTTSIVDAIVAGVPADQVKDRMIALNDRRKQIDAR